MNCFGQFVFLIASQLRNTFYSLIGSLYFDNDNIAKLERKRNIWICLSQKNQARSKSIERLNFLSSFSFPPCSFLNAVFVSFYGDEFNRLRLVSSNFITDSKGYVDMRKSVLHINTNFFPSCLTGTVLCNLRMRFFYSIV